MKSVGTQISDLHVSLFFDGVPETVFFWTSPLGTTTTAGGILTEDL
jgi:hypothetical protein